MTSKNSSGVAGSERLNEVLAAYLEALEADQAVDQRAWLRRYPDLAAELAEFFANRERLAPLADPLRTAATVCPENGNGTPPGPGDGEGSLFGNYQILEEIARGGMGVVYRARQVGLKRVVALKMILAGQLAGTGALRRFRTEAEADASFDHPNIVPIYEIGERDGHHYFTMKLQRGSRPSSR